jgi:flagellar motor switch protein FliM
MGLAAGDLVPLPMAALDRIGFEGLDGRRLAEGKLGQNRGMRAVRLSAPAVADMPDNVIAMRAVGMG